MLGVTAELSVLIHDSSSDEILIYSEDSLYSLINDEFDGLNREISVDETELVNISTLVAFKL